jgi:hypothetical protein
MQAAGLEPIRPAQMHYSGIDMGEEDAGEGPEGTN